jgi:saccharopine dehydrogenase-like NADP-dependent oxidoreductase
VIARHLAASPSVRELVLADLDERLPTSLASQLGSSARVRPTGLDASDARALERVLDGSEVVVQASVPRFNAGIQGAALASGAHYIDLACDSSDPFGPSDEWRRRGLTAIVGMGEDPGLSNLMARRSADRLDRVDSIRIRDGDTASNPELPFLPLFSPETFIEETLHASRIWEDGKYRDVPPFGEGEVYDFPAPVGPQKVYSVDHEEVDSMPRFIGKGVRYVDFKLALDDATVRILQTLRDLKLLDRGTPEAPGPRRAVLSALPKPADLAGKVGGYACLVVEVVGERAGTARRETLYALLSHPSAHERYGTTATGYLTGTPAAAAVLLLLEGGISERGLLPPEALRPEPFFAKLRERGVTIHARETVEHPLDATVPD